MARKSTKSLLEDAPAHGADVYNRLLHMIRNGELKPGTRLREARLAASLGVSRTPVREALRRLEMQGLVTHELHRGAIVRELDHNTITELYFMREVLEGTAAALAARHASQAEIETLREMIESDHKRLGNPTKLAQTNQHFHSALYRASHNRYLVEMLQGLRTSMWLLGPTTLSLQGRDQEALEEHARIVDAIENGSPEEADAAARLHIRQAHRMRLKLIFEEENRQQDQMP